MKKTNKKIVFFFGIISLICVIFLGMGGCKKVIVPNAIITVSNECGLAIDFTLNGEFQFSVEYEQTGTIENLPDGTHLLEARRKGTGEFVAQKSLDVRVNRIYTWSVLSSADVNIINNYGETLGIYGDDLYLGVVADLTNSKLEHVPYGDHKFEARTNEETVVATTTISILADNTYEWTIIK